VVGREEARVPVRVSLQQVRPGQTADYTTTLPQRTAEPSSQDGGASWKMYLRKGKILPDVKERQEKCEKQPCETKDRRAGGG